MGRTSPGQTSFNAGELSPLLSGRPDLAKYPAGCSVLENFIPTVQGPARARGGFRYAGPTLQASRSWLVPFSFNYAQSFLLEFAETQLGFWYSRARVTIARAISNVADNGVGFMRVTASGHGFYTGNVVTIAAVTGTGDITNANGTHSVVRVDANNFDIPVAMAGTYGAGGTATGPYALTTPYTAAGLVNSDGTSALSRVQTGDIVYLAGGGQPAQKLSRFGNTNWTLAEFRPDDGPYMDQNTTEATTIYASAATGTGITLTASDSIFTANHVGALVRLEPVNISVEQWEPTVAVSVGDFRRYGSNVYEAMAATGSNTGTVPPTHTRGEQEDGSASASVTWKYLHSGYGVARITAASGTTATADVISRLPADVVTAGNATWRWRFGAWGAHNEYPKFVTIWRDRLVFGGLRNLWFSKAGEYEKFSPDEYGQVTTASGITILVGSVDNNAIRWLSSGDALLVGTASTEFAVSENTTSDPVGPANIKAPPKSSRGSRSVAPVKIGEAAALFTDVPGRRVWEVNFDRETAVYQTQDRTLLSEHITSPGITDMAYQSAPDSVVWAALSDGGLIGMTYERDQEVWGWHRHPLGGDGNVESLAVLPAPAGDRDDLWLATQRDGLGRFIEYLDPGYESGADPMTAFYLDAGLTYNGAQAAQLVVPAGATTTGNTGVVFNAGAAVFTSTDVGRYIVNRYLDGTVWRSAMALITGFGSSTAVACTIVKAWPAATTLAASSWYLTAATVSGLDHLEGEQVTVLVNGATHPARTVASGAISLEWPGAMVHVGLFQGGRLRTMRPEAGRPDGFAQGKIKRIHRAQLRFVETGTCQFGGSFDALDTITFRTPQNAMDEAPPLYTGDVEQPWPTGYDTDGYLCIVQGDPRPLTLAAIWPVIETAER